MSSRKIDTWIWGLIYAGMALGALGLSVQRSDAVIGWAIALAGMALFVVGALLVVVRSRIGDKP